MLVVEDSISRGVFLANTISSVSSMVIDSCQKARLLKFLYVIDFIFSKNFCQVLLCFSSIFKR